MKIVAIIFVGCALALTSCSAFIKHTLNSDLITITKNWKNHPNPSGYPNQKAPTP